MSSSTILSDNGVTSGSAGVKSTGGSDGTLLLQTTTAGGVATTAVTVDNAQKVGIGTTSPSSPLTISKTGATAIEISSGPTYPVNSYGAGTGATQFAIANTGGTSYFGNESSAAGTSFTGTSAYATLLGTSAARSLQFVTNNAVQATIDSSGNFLVGTTTGTTYRAQFVCADQYAFLGYNTNSAKSVGDIWNASTTGDSKFFNFLTEAGGTQRGSITYNRAGGLTAYNVTSDYRAKTVNGLVQNALQKVAQLKPCSGRMNDAEQDIDFFVAHELQEVVPSAVTGEKDAVNEDGTPNYQMVDKSALIPLLTAAIQEQQALLSSQAAVITSLTERITALEAK